MPTPLEVKQQQLTEVRAAISAILTGGQQYSIQNRQITRASLATLQERERQLELEVSRLERGGIGVNYGLLS